MSAEVLIQRECFSCKQSFKFLVNEADFIHWSSGIELIQNAMPYLTDNQRELLISGFCGECFDELYADEDEEDNENETSWDL